MNSALNIIGIALLTWLLSGYFENKIGYSPPSEKDSNQTRRHADSFIIRHNRALRVVALLVIWLGASIYSLSAGVLGALSLGLFAVGATAYFRTVCWKLFKAP